ncbi:MAG: aldose 1-epimerase family protein [Planctomycetales bacterium]
MAAHCFPITDRSRRIWHDSFSLAPSSELELNGSANWSVKKQTLHGGVSEGVEVVELHNGRLALSILPTRGMGIWKGVCGNLELGWNSPVEWPVHPAFVNALDRGGIGWLAGFNEWVCRCGLDQNGPPGPDGTLHGRIANLPAHTVEVRVETAGEGTLAVTGVVDESMMFGPNLRLRSTVVTTAGSTRFTIIDEITNRRGTPADVQLLYHINTGRPFLEAGGQCLAPTREVAPRDPRAAEGIDDYDRYAPPAAGYAEQVYYYDLATDATFQTVALLRNGAGDRGLSLHFDQRELPCFSLWKNTQSEQEGYVTGLEPATNLPNQKAFERSQGRVIELPPGETYRVRLEIAVHGTAEEVQQVEAQIARLQGETPPRVHRAPRGGWSPA